jgi:hypothetical protein
MSDENKNDKISFQIETALSNDKEWFYFDLKIELTRKAINTIKNRLIVRKEP